MTDESEQASRLTAVLRQRLVEYGANADITPDDVVVAALTLLVSSISGYEREEDRRHAAERIMEILPGLLNEALAPSGDRDDVRHMN
jgi:hypothetical protein